MSDDAVKHLVIKHEGAFIDLERLRKLAFTDVDNTDRERELRVALQDALVLAGIYRGGRWTECTTEHGMIRYKEIAAHAESERLRAGLKEALDRWEGIDLSDYAHSGNGYRGQNWERIAELRKLVGP